MLMLYLYWLILFIGILSHLFISLLQKILSTYSVKLKKIIKQEKKRSQIKKSGIEIDDFPGGADGFELVSRFCYNNGRISITISNVFLLHCCAIFLGMSDKASACNLLQQTESFLEGIFYWSWSDILVGLKSCSSFFTHADSYGLLQKLISALLARIAQNSDTNFITSSSSSSSSPETTSFRFSTPDSIKPSSSSRAWWFDDLATLPPNIIEKVIQSLGAYGTDNNSLVLTKFLLHYLKTAAQKKANNDNAFSRCEYSSLADTAIHGVIMVGRTAFSCRSLLWVLRVVSGFGLKKDYRIGLEKLIGGMLDKATLDDLLVSGNDRGVYDVNLVLRLIRIFVCDDEMSICKMKKVGRLIDKYLGEISPDQNLKISKFLGVAESLPDSARDCFDGVYRAIDTYIEVNLTYPFYLFPYLLMLNY